MPLLNLDMTYENHAVYRTFKFDHVLDLITQRRLVHVAPHMWDDPYENLMLKYAEHQHGVDTDVVMKWYGKDLYGTCWTWIPESDFAWRVYVEKGDIGVVAESTIGKLLSAVHGWGGMLAMRDCFVGSVMYQTGKEIMNTITSDSFQKSNDSSDTAHVRALSLLLKRPEFIHEDEVRTIIECSERNQIREPGLIDIPIDPSCFIDRLVIDPRIDAEGVRTAELQIRAAGYDGNISQSELYRLPW